MIFRGVSLDRGHDVILKGLIERPDSAINDDQQLTMFDGVAAPYKEWKKIATNIKEGDRIAFKLADPKDVEVWRDEYSGYEKLAVVTVKDVNIVTERADNVVVLARKGPRL